MLNLISKTPDSVIEQVGLDNYLKYCGVLNTHRTGYSVNNVIDKPYKWALDNYCYIEYNPQKILDFLHKFRGLKNCLFAVLPDIVGSHEQTTILSHAWLGTYQALGYPVAFVIQNGATVDNVSYDTYDCIFIGGDNDFKESQNARLICLEAKSRGLWIHAGRVGSKRRLQIMRDFFKIDSYDSSGFSIYPPKIKEFLPLHQVNQLTLFEE